MPDFLTFLNHRIPFLGTQIAPMSLWTCLQPSIYPSCCPYSHPHPALFPHLPSHRESRPKSGNSCPPRGKNQRMLTLKGNLEVLKFKTRLNIGTRHIHSTSEDEDSQSSFDHWASLIVKPPQSELQAVPLSLSLYDCGTDSGTSLKIAIKKDPEYPQIVLLLCLKSRISSGEQLASRPSLLCPPPSTLHLLTASCVPSSPCSLCSRHEAHLASYCSSCTRTQHIPYSGATPPQPLPHPHTHIWVSAPSSTLPSGVNATRAEDFPDHSKSVSHHWFYCSP